jgi:phosphatidylinositol-3-phosphatase
MNPGATIRLATLSLVAVMGWACSQNKAPRTSSDSAAQETPVTAPAKPSHIQTVFVILMENHNWSEVKGRADAPYINQTLLPMASHAEQYFSPPGIHPSLPNYLWLEAGTNFGILDDDSPDANHQSTALHLVTLLENSGIAWKAYEENISARACPLASQGEYAVKHDPFVYFDDVTNNLSPASVHCTAHVRPFTELAADLASNSVARYNFITPNLCDDMHDACTTGPLRQGDAWLSENVPAILNSAAYNQAGALFITWDESEGGDVPIGMIVLSPFAKGSGYQNSTHYTHGSTLRSLQEIFGVTPLLGDAARQKDLSDLFRVFP